MKNLLEIEDFEIETLIDYLMINIICASFGFFIASLNFSLIISIIFIIVFSLLASIIEFIIDNKII